MSATDDQANPRNCYCRPGETSCGTCDRCGAAGHTRHFPGPVPYTGAWCDRCYTIVGRTYLIKRIVYPLGIAAAIALVIRKCT